MIRFLDEVLPRYWKAVMGFAAPGAVVLTYAVVTDSPGKDRITAGEWWTIAAACVITSAGVAVTRNRPAGPPPSGDGPRLVP